MVVGKAEVEADATGLDEGAGGHRGGSQTGRVGGAGGNTAEALALGNVGCGDVRGTGDGVGIT